MATIFKADPEAPNEIGRVISILGGPDIFKSPISGRLDAHKVIERGFPTGVLTKLISNVTLLKDDDAFQKSVGISKRTFYRLQKGDDPSKRLSAEQSGRTWKFAEILAKAISVFGNQTNAERWMEEPAIGLDGMRPIDLLSTTAGTELVETYLEQIEYGVYV